jgi:hypothetical protein
MCVVVVVVATTKILKSISILLKELLSSFDDNPTGDMFVNDCFRN